MDEILVKSTYFEKRTYFERIENLLNNSFIYIYTNIMEIKTVFTNVGSCVSSVICERRAIRQ